MRKSESQKRQGVPVIRESPRPFEVYLQELNQNLRMTLREKSPLASSREGRKVTILKYIRAFCSSLQGLPTGETN